MHGWTKEYKLSKFEVAQEVGQKAMPIQMLEFSHLPLNYWVLTEAHMSCVDLYLENTKVGFRLVLTGLQPVNGVQLFTDHMKEILAQVHLP